jgi:lysophospholipase L1-like esterase
MIEDATASEGVAVQFTLPHTDQVGFQDEAGNAYQNWYYTATIQYSTDKGTKAPFTKVFQLTTGQTTVDLDLLPSGAPAMPYTAPIAGVTSVNGSTGAVTVPVTTDANVAAFVQGTGPTATALNAAYAPASGSANYAAKAEVLPKWKATTAYTAGDPVVNPSGDVVTAKANFTSGASYSATNWNYSAYALGKFVSKAPNTVIPFGTSITNQGFITGSSGQLGNSAKGYLTWANIALGHRLSVIRNAGISGNNSTQMLARIDADVIAYSPGWCVVESGMPNDIGSGFTIATIIANHKAIYDKLAAAGIRVVVCTSLPYGLSTALSTRQQQHSFNAWAKAYARDNGHVLCDWGSAVVDPASSTGLWLPNYSDGVTSGTDGVHPTPPAALKMGKVLAAALDTHLPKLAGEWLPTSSADPYNLLGTMGYQVGTSGTVTAPGTGQVATGWTIYNGTTNAFSASKVARTDGVNGEWQQIAVTTGNVDGLTYKAQNMNVGTDFNVGDTILCAFEYEADAGWTNFHDINAGIDMYGGAYNWKDASGTGADPNLNQDLPLKGVFLASGVVPASTTRLQPNLYFKTGTGTLRIGRVGLYNLTTLSTVSSYTLKP